jgi:acyl dehydratase
MFGGLAASGWHTAAITMRLLVDQGFLADGLVGLGVEIAWPRPTRPGDTLSVQGEVLEIVPSKSRADRGIVVMRNETRNQDGEVVQQFTGRMLVFRKSRE